VLIFCSKGKTAIVVRFIEDYFFDELGMLLVPIVFGFFLLLL